MRTIMMTGKLAGIALLLAGVTSCSGQPDYRDIKEPPKTVRSVDLNKFAGKWYEIARYDNRFERNCEGVTAVYELNPDDTISVTNTCREGKPTGAKRQAKGIARVVNPPNNSKLKVKFAPSFIPFAEGDYWILHLEKDYSVALVGDPEGKYLWILSRTPKISSVVLARVLETANNQGYKVGPLYMTEQADLPQDRRNGSAL